MKMTMPQIIMLNHAAWCNSQEHKSEKSISSPDDPVVYKGKRLSELTSDDMRHYYSDWG